MKMRRIFVHYIDLSLDCILNKERCRPPFIVVIKNLPTNARDVGPCVGRSPGEGNGTHASILAWKIPWTEEPEGLTDCGVAKSQQDLVTKQQ